MVDKVQNPVCVDTQTGFCYCFSTMLYTRKGDKGTTKTLRGDARISKDSALTEALGTVDELNSVLGLCKVHAGRDVVMIGDEKEGVASITEEVQKNLFIVQAELAGADKTISEEKIKDLERVTDAIEKQLPPIKSFLVSGGTELGAHFDIARSVSRRAERRVVSVVNQGVGMGEHTLGYLNRLSSLLYALARHSNYKSGIKESAPDYK